MLKSLKLKTHSIGISAIILALSTACAINGDMFGGKSPRFFESLKYKTVTVYMTSAYGGGGKCSGVILAKDTVATAAHCVRSPSTVVEVEFYKGEKREMRKILKRGKAATKNDYLIIDVDVPSRYEQNIRPHLRCDLPPIGSKIVHVGSPVESRWATLFGYIASYNTNLPRYGSWKGAVAADIHGGPGSSGGPLFDLNGHLVGLLVAGGTGSGMVLYVPTRQFAPCNVQ